MCVGIVLNMDSIFVLKTDEYKQAAVVSNFRLQKLRHAVKDPSGSNSSKITNYCFKINDY